MHFRKLPYLRRGTNDFLGFDDGTRKNKIFNSFLGNFFDPRLNNSITSLTYVNKISNQFDPQMAPIDDISGMNYNFNISYGNQIKFENGHSFGYLGSLSYRKEQSIYENSQDNIFNFSPDSQN